MIYMMKKVVCINKNNNPHLTVGKIYIVKRVHNSGNRYKLVNDIDLDYHYDARCFISLREYRKRKLEKIERIKNGK